MKSTVKIAGRVVTNKHTDALESLLKVNVRIEQRACNNKYGWKDVFCVWGHEFKTRRELADHLLKMVNAIEGLDLSKLTKVKSNSCPAFEFN